jgi:transposase
VSERFPAEAVAVIADLRAQLAQRDATIASLVARVEALEARLGKNSSNSSKPPSSDDPFTKPKPHSLRGKSGRRPGKQPGQPGGRLKPRPDPDQRRVHVPEMCGGCGADLADAEVIGERRRQVFDLPPIHLEVVEHCAQVRRCGCGRETTAPFPAAAKAPACYGPGLAAVATYLLVRQHVPIARTAELLADCFGAPVSTGWLAGLLPGAEARLAGFARLTRAQLREAPVAGFDETGARIGGKLWWVHVACTSNLTAYHRASGRGKDSMNLGQVLPAFEGIAVHDGLNSYQGYPKMAGHGLCNAHHLRELVALTEANQRNGTTQDTPDTPEITWPQQMIDLLVEINTTVNHAKTAGHTALPTRQLARFRRRYRAVIAEGQKAHPPPPPTGKQGRPKLGVAGSLLRRLDIHQDDVLRFATDFRVPFDNNQAERDIRMIRVQQKISGTWRTDTGADAFLAVRSYLSTARKQGHNALDVLRDLYNGAAWLPTPT